MQLPGLLYMQRCLRALRVIGAWCVKGSWPEPVRPSAPARFGSNRLTTTTLHSWTQSVGRSITVQCQPAHVHPLRHCITAASDGPVRNAYSDMFVGQSIRREDLTIDDGATEARKTRSMIYRHPVIRCRSLYRPRATPGDHTTGFALARASRERVNQRIGTTRRTRRKTNERKKERKNERAMKMTKSHNDEMTLPARSWCRPFVQHLMDCLDKKN